MRRFWSYHGWEALLCLAASAALVLNFSQGFYIPNAVADSVPLALLVCGLTLLYAYLGSYNRAAMACFTSGFFVIAAGFFLWLRGKGVDIVDQEGSATAVYIYYIAAPLITLLAFLLSRSRLGTAALFLMGAVLHGLIAFLGYEVKSWCAALFTAAVTALFLLRSYRAAALRSNTIKPDFARYFCMSAGVSLAGLLLALAVWGLVLRPLRPPVLDLELLTKYMSYEVLEMVGVAKQYPVPSELWTEDGSEQTLQGNEPERREEAPPEREELPDSTEASGDNAAAVPDAAKPLSSVSYERNMGGFLAALIALAALLAAAVPLSRRYARKRRLSGLIRGDPREQIIGLYRFYLEKFARIGFSRSPAQTEWEYAARYSEQLSPYLEGGPTLPEMTALYMDARYGGLPVSEESCRAMAELYPVFLRNYRELAGRVLYLRNYFVL